MPKHVTIKKKIKPFNKEIKVPGDKSLSIRWALLASQAIGMSKAYNLLKSEVVISTINFLKKLGVKIIWNKKKNFCEILCVSQKSSKTCLGNKKHGLANGRF